MTAQGRYAATDSSFGRSAGNAAARGGALVAVAVVIGFLLLWQGSLFTVAMSFIVVSEQHD